MNFVSIKFEDEGVGYSMSEKKDYELPLQFRQVSPWAGRWNDYFRMAREQAEQNVETVERVVNEEEA